MENELVIELAPRPSLHPFYTCGDIVKGSVILQRPTHARTTDVFIKFTGIAKSEIVLKGNSHHQQCHSSEVLLFSYTQELVNTKWSDGRKTFSWPFEFTFPSGTQSTPCKERFSRDENFYRGPDHSLPPTWMESSGPEEASYGCVSYHLEATTANGAVKPSSRKHQITVPFAHVREVEEYHPILSPINWPLSRSSHLLDPNFHSHEHERWKHSFHAHEHTIGGHAMAIHVPTSHFDVHIELPEIMCAGDKIPMFIEVSHDFSRTTAPVIPTIFLKRFHITLETHTQVRAPAGFLHLGQEPQDSWSETSTVADGGALHLPLSQRIDVHEFIEKLSISDELTPTFRTFNVARYYVIRFKVEVECAQKCYELDEERKLFLLPAVYQPSRVTPRSIPQARAIVSPIDDAPPPYEEVETSTRGSRGGHLPSFNPAGMGIGVSTPFSNSGIGAAF